MSDERWSRPVVAEVEENRRALRRMRVVVWIAVGLTAAVCLWAGVFVGMVVYGGG